MSPGVTLRSVALALGAGGFVAFGIACGAAQRSPSAASAQTTRMDPLAGMAPDHRDAHTKIDVLDADIATEMSQLGLARLPADARVELPCLAASTCTAQAMSSGTERPEADPTCTPGKSTTCTDSCTFADSICANAGKICAIASDLEARDDYANSKCAAGKSSCTAASDRCCSCL